MANHGRTANGKDNRNPNPSILHCADLILPWLNPTDLSSISLTCKTLHHIAKSITTRRIADASRNLENNPITFINTVDDQPYFDFIYTPTQTLPNSLLLSPWGSDPTTTRPGFDSTRYPVHVAVAEDASGCACKMCDDGGCPCWIDSSELARECGPSCGCGLECGNRASQGGVSVRVKIVKHVDKGWGLHADQLIPRGQFVCEYAGELLTTKEARMRQQIYDRLQSGGRRFSSALLVVREHLPSRNACMRINIDATKISNAARFINHSCDGGNLSTLLVRSSGSLLPRLCFFASRDILQNEELTYSYGDSRLESKGLPCFCGSSCCPGVMPYEYT